MADYDPKIIQQFADKLYSQANTIIAVYTLIIGTVCGVVFYVIKISMHVTNLNSLVGFAVGAVIGYFFGKEKAFELKLKAQTALCQVKIEENTRK